MSNNRALEIEALKELKGHLGEGLQLEPLQRYVQEKLLEAGENPNERMSVMMELIRFSLYLELLPEFKELKGYVGKLEEELKEKSFSMVSKDEKDSA